MNDQAYSRDPLSRVRGGASPRRLRRRCSACFWRRAPALRASRRGAVGPQPHGDGTMGPMSSDTDGKLTRLRAELAALGRVVVACSGGVDSCLLAVVAHQELGPSALVVTAVSPAVPAEEVAQVEALAAEHGFRWRAVETEELARPGYVANAGDRCYHCRSELFDVLGPIAAAEGPDVAVAVGTIVDDLSDHRPGQRAAAERGVRTPLADAGFSKADV